ncbi:hypothetical protein GCM10028777_27430 [Angustibacter speluncae]
MSVAPAPAAPLPVALRAPRAAGRLAGVTRSDAVDALQVTDFRRQVAAGYAAVRASSDPATAHGAWVAEHVARLREHPVSPVLPEHRATEVAVAPYDPAFRFVVPIEPAPPERIEVPTGTDGVVPYERVGLVRLGDLGSLDVWWHDGYGGGLFVPFRDTTSRDGGYGGGRYLLDTTKGADLGTDAGGSRLVVDLNFAYHPSCAYDPRWACPLAPPGNVLDAAVPVGELYRGPWAQG